MFVIVAFLCFRVVINSNFKKISRVLVLGEWKEGGSRGDLLSAGKLKGRGSSRDSVDIGSFGEQGVGRVPGACSKERQDSSKPGPQRVLKLKAAKAFVVT